jgi:HD-GYP domain-containing protein (c-di-GMP phosphodiesterase class II)
VGGQIPTGARIVAIADAWDAMVSDRPYRVGLEREEAVGRLRAGSGKQWDADMIPIFLALLDDGLVQRVTDSQLAATV